MEISEENINAVVKVLMSGKFDKALGTVQEYSNIAKELMEKYPDKTPDEIGKIYEELAKQKENEDLKTQEENNQDQKNQEEIGRDED